MTLVIIPSRIGSTRLPRKAMQHIAHKTIIRHVVDRVREAGFVPVVATDSEEIAGVCECSSVMTPSELRSGTDRVAHAAEIIDPAGTHNLVVNVQGDMPLIDPAHLRAFILRAGQLPIQDCLTACVASDYVDATGAAFVRGTILQHVGIYAFSRRALRQFAALPSTAIELEERLEQHRLDGYFMWNFVCLPRMPLEINTPADLAEAQRMFGA